MEEKIINVFFDSNGLPYKDKELQVHFPIVGNAFLGASETTKIRFYYDNLGSERVTWVSVAKLPNGKQGSKVLSGSADSNGNYVELALSNWYTQAKGDVYIALQGYQGGVTYTYDSESELYVITGTPTIQTTGSIKLAINYAPIGDVPSYSDEFTTYQQVLAALGTKVSDIDTIIVVSNVATLTPSDYSDGQVFFNLNDNALYRLSSGTISKYMEWYTKGETNTLLNAKADKVGDLPKYTVSSSDNVLTFINNNDVVGKPIVISVSNQNYIGQFTSTGSETSYVFEFEYLGGPQRYVNANPTNMNITFSTLFGTTYRQNYEITENKVTTLSSSSTDTQYPSAKCVYDKDVLLQQGIDQSGHSIVASLNSTTYVLTISLKDANGNILGTSQTIDLPLESIVTSATYYDSYTYGGTTYTKVIVLVLSTTDVPTIIPVGDLVSGLVSTSDLSTALQSYVPTSRTIAGNALTSNIDAQTLTDSLVFATNTDIDNLF